MNRIDCGWKSFLCAALCLTIPAPCTLAATALANLSYAPDISVAVTATTTLNDETVAIDNRAGVVTPVDLGVLPANVAVDGFHRLDAGIVLFSLDTTAALGNLIVRPGDVVRYNGIGYSLEFDASAAGLPDNLNIDAVSRRDTLLILAFDTAVVLNGILFQDEDLAGFNGTAFTMEFDGSAAGIAAGLALDAAEVLGNGQLLLSFDGSGQAGSNVVFADEDVLEYTVTSAIWELAFDGSAAVAAWVGADLEALEATAAGGLIFSDQFEN